MKAAACVAAAGLLAYPLALATLLAGGNHTASADATSAGAPTAYARDDIPPDYLRWYTDAAQTCPSLPWAVLAAIGKVESDHGRSPLPGIRSGENHAGAGGPMQFLAATWAAYGADGNHDSHKNRYNPADAIHGAANYLCANHASQGGKHLHQAIWRYNHADWYVRKVLAQAGRYAAPTSSGRGAVAVRAALRWRGTPYSWGGGGPSGPTYGIEHGANIKGFDCSGLTQYAWAKAGVMIARVAADQYDDGPHIPRHALASGDLLFFATNPRNPRTIHHVGIYLGRGRMVHAPQTGDVVREAEFARSAYRQRQYVGATRPTPRNRHQ
ncbi:NlpC/P60 family protein [Spirillospora sp. NPDC048911]|uniref:C40 family peptidase n=1 Tax=Spirillospora sp. NPDC048911 TaxID=3364527 RepID=UPI003715412D